MVRHLLFGAVLLLIVGASTASAQRFPLPWLVTECNAPYAPFGTSAKAVIDTMTFGGAFDLAFTVENGDTTVMARVGPRTKVRFYIKASAGLERIIMEMEFINEREAQKQHDIALQDLRMWYVRQLRFKMYDEEHMQRCGDHLQVIRATTGEKYDLPKIFRLTFERRPA